MRKSRLTEFFARRGLNRNQENVMPPRKESILIQADSISNFECADDAPLIRHSSVLLGMRLLSLMCCLD